MDLVIFTLGILGLYSWATFNKEETLVRELTLKVLDLTPVFLLFFVEPTLTVSIWIVALLLAIQAIRINGIIGAVIYLLTYSFAGASIMYNDFNLRYLIISFVITLILIAINAPMLLKEKVNKFILISGLVYGLITFTSLIYCSIAKQSPAFSLLVLSDIFLAYNFIYKADIGYWVNMLFYTGLLLSAPLLS